MPTTYAGADSYPTGITIPSDGDVKGAATVNVALEGLADRTRWFQGFIMGWSPGAHLLSPTLSGTITVEDPIRGDGTFLTLSQPGEGTRILGSLLVAENATFVAGHIAQFDGTWKLNGTGHVLTGNLLSIDTGATLSVYGQFVSNTNAGFLGTVVLACPVGLSGVITPSGAGGIAARPFNANPAGGGTYGVLDGNRMALVGTLAGAISHTLTSANAYEGAELFISLQGLVDGGFLVNFLRDDATVFLTMSNTPGGVLNYAHCLFRSGAWTLFHGTQRA